MFQAIVSVIAVNTQFNSPNIVRRSFNVPGILIITDIDKIIKLILQNILKKILTCQQGQDKTLNNI